MPVLLVRHGRAGNRSKWHGDDLLRPLSRRGLRQARDLVAVLDPFKPLRILSSPFVRCVQTVQPLADTPGLKVEEAEELAEGHGAEATSLLGDLLQRHRAVVACTHGDVVLHALRALARDVPDQPPLAKGSVWVLERPKHEADGDGSRAVPAIARYLPPPG